jgi:isoleucyl-tRNA synthetase
MPHLSTDDVRNVLLNDMPEYDEGERFAEVEAKYDALFAMRDEVLSALEVARASKVIGKSLEAKVEYSVHKDAYKWLSELGEDVLSDIFIVSQTKLVNGGDKLESDVKVMPADGEKCARCWKHSVDAIEVDGEHICPRCKKILGI